MPHSRIQQRRQPRRELGIRAFLFSCAAVSILTTAAILILLTTESLRFFALDEVSVTDFLLGTQWNPLTTADKKFGVLPLVAGTLLVAAISAIVSLPLGLLTAIFLSEYAPRKLRAVLKPALEILAGIPTVVYGFFAITVITPALASIIPSLNAFNALSAGIAMGIMCLPIVSSLSEDAIQSVPRSLREGAHAVGGTKFDVIVKVVIPAALSGIIAAFLLAIARAVGETMIVALAAGNRPNLTADPTQPVQTMTAYIVATVKGETPYGSIERQSIFAVGALLFVITFIITIAGNLVMRKFREIYE